MPAFDPGAFDGGAFSAGPGPLGADKVIEFDPPGAIGLVDLDRVLVLRFDETEATTRPQDEDKVCQDFDVLHGSPSTTMPALVDATLGRGRQFGAGAGLSAVDINPGATLLTRDMSIQVVLLWDAAGQQAIGTPGVIIARGRGTGPAEYVCYGLRIDVVDATAGVGLVRWFWQDVAGVDHIDAGALVIFPSGKFTMVTATRRWVSPTSVALSYYVGDQLAGQVTSAGGSIGGGLTGTVQLGYRAIAAAPAQFLAGTIDELMVLDRELCPEEVEATWLRITVYQPLGVQLFAEMFDEDFPISQEPDSDARLDIRMTGHALGFAAAKMEEFRANFMPQRSYGSVLEDWETAFQTTPQQPQGISIPDRRARVLAKAREQAGCSLDGLRDVLTGLLGGADVSQLQFLAFGNTIREEFATLSTLVWDMTPTACAALVAGAATFAPGAGTYVAGPGGGWLTMVTSVCQSTLPGVVGQEHLLGKLALTTPQSGAETGILFADRARGRYILLGLRDAAGVFEIVAEVFDRWVSSGLIVMAVLGANPATLWLHLHQLVDASWVAEWSTTSESTGYSSAPLAAYGTDPIYWAGAYLRSTGALAGGPVAAIDMLTLFTPQGSSPFSAYVLLDDSLGFAPDIAGARSAVATIRHAFVEGTFITKPAVVYDDPDNGYDTGPFGG